MVLKSAWKSAAARRLLSVTGETTVEQAVEALTVRLLADLQCPPTDLNALAQRLGVVEIRQESLPVAGLLRRETAGLVILVSANQSPGRMRFTFAHELGHAFFHTTGHGSPRRGRELERICDMLAASLLMPADMMREVIDEPPAVTDILKVAEAFDVSRTAAAIRCYEVFGLHFLEVGADRSIRVSRGVLREFPSFLDELLDNVLDGRRVDESSRLDPNRFWNGDWIIQGIPLGRTKRALFALWPSVPETAVWQKRSSTHA